MNNVINTSRSKNCVVLAVWQHCTSLYLHLGWVYAYRIGKNAKASTRNYYYPDAALREVI